MNDVQMAVLVSTAITKAVDLLRNSFDKDDTRGKWIWNALAFGLGIAVALSSQWNLLHGTNVNDFLGYILSGVILGGGGSAVHEVLDVISTTAKKNQNGSTSSASPGTSVVN
jgi:hypothetical protein